MNTIFKISDIDTDLTLYTPDNKPLNPELILQLDNERRILTFILTQPDIKLLIEELNKWTS